MSIYCQHKLIYFKKITSKSNEQSKKNEISGKKMFRTLDRIYSNFPFFFYLLQEIYNLKGVKIK